MNELVEVLVANNPHHFLGDALHILEQLLELADELCLCWLEGHTVPVRIVVYCGLDAVLLLVLLILAHLHEYEVGALLVDLHLGLHDHVVDEPDESAETMVVTFCELQHSVLELVLLFLEHH